MNSDQEIVGYSAIEPDCSSEVGITEVIILAYYRQSGSKSRNFRIDDNTYTAQRKRGYSDCQIPVE